MSPPTRRLPYVGQAAEVVDLGPREPAVVTQVEGTAVWVRVAGAPAEQAFDLHPVTACFVRRGDPYWGTRLRLDDDAP